MSLQEIFTNKEGKISKPFDNRYVATFFVVLAAALLAFSKPAAEGALALWPLFGSLNQLLAALALTIVSVYLIQKKKNVLIVFVPMVFVLLMTIWAMVDNIIVFIIDKDYILVILSFIILLLSLWLLISSIISLLKLRNEYKN